MAVKFWDYGSGDWIASEPTFGSPPTCLEGASCGTYMRKNISLDTSTGEPVIVVTITLNEIGSEDDLLVFMEETAPFNPEDMAGMINLVWFGYDLACDFSGRYYISPRSSREAVVYAFDETGARRFSIEMDLDPVLRNEEEMETERLILTSKAAAMGDLPPALEPDPYKPLIRGLEVDSEGKIWILLGGPPQPEFEVYSPDGEFLYRAVISGEQPDGASWNFSFSGGRILAWAEDPCEGYQKIWLLEPESH
jgi:hypothetical protein